jgi:hypothetical protein
LLTRHQVSQRGVVFFRKQDNLDNNLQKELAQRLGELSGKPSTSKLHIHPVSNSGRRLGGKDDEISVISSEQAKEIYKGRLANFSGKKQSAKAGWHSDITFEPIPSDYALLRLTELPKTGGGAYNTHLASSVLTTNPLIRHPLGIWLRTVRPALRTVSEVFREPDCNLRAARVQPRGQREQLRTLLAAPRRSREYRLRPHRRPPCDSHEPSHGLEIYLWCRSSRAIHQWAYQGRIAACTGLVRPIDYRKS